jgi:hypothetical protein
MARHSVRLINNPPIALYSLIQKMLWPRSVETSGEVGLSMQTSPGPGSDAKVKTDNNYITHVHKVGLYSTRF